MVRVRTEHPAGGAPYLAVYDDREEGNAFSVPYRDYVENASKFNFIRNMLINFEALSGTMDEEERSSFTKDIEAALQNPDCCYSLEETTDRIKRSAEYSDIFQELSRTDEDRAVQEIASDMKALEDSVEDAQIAYYMDNVEFDALAKETEEAVNTVDSLSGYDGSDIHTDSLLDKDSAGKVKQAQEILNDITGKGFYKSLDDNIRESVLREISRHPFRYSVFAARESFKEILNMVKESRAYVNASESSFLDTVSSGVNAVECRTVAAKQDIMEAVKSASVYTAESLNEAYTKGSEMLEHSKDAMKKICASILQKADRIAEVLTLGGFSRMLEAAQRKAFIAVQNEEASKGDRIICRLVELHARSHGYSLDVACENLVSIRQDVWKNEGISPLDRIEHSWKDVRYKAEKAQTDLKLSLIGELIHAKEHIMDAKDTVSIRLEAASLRAKEACLDLQASALQNAVRFYERLDKVNDYRIGHLFDKTYSLYEKRSIHEEKSAAWKEKAEAAKQSQVQMDPSVQNAVDILSGMENIGTAEKFALAAMKHDTRVKELKSNIKNGIMSDIYAGQAVFEDETVKELNNAIEKREDKLEALYGRMDSIVDKIASLNDRIGKKALESMQLFDKRMDLIKDSGDTGILDEYDEEVLDALFSSDEEEEFMDKEEV